MELFELQTVLFLFLFLTVQKRHLLNSSKSQKFFINMSKNFLDFRPAHLVKGKNCNYISYSVINPETGNFVVKRIKLNYIKNKTQLKQYAEELTTQINLKLARGFNPFLCESSDKLILLNDAILDFLKARKRDLEQKIICNATFQDYKQQLNYFSEYISNCFIFKIKRADINNFLDDIYINKSLTAVTRNHYLQTVRTFFNWCVNKGYISENPAKEISNKKNGLKKRAAIPGKILNMIFEYFKENNKHGYLLACYLIYSCFIRPSELCKIKIKDISFMNQTIFISKDISKNKKNQVVTVPQNVMRLMLDLEVYKYQSECFLIGKNFTPSETKCSDKILRAEWLRMRKKLKLSDNYMLYSLKDTGITQMINILNVAEVRDQARHSSISITDVYTDRTHTDGNEHIKKMNFTPEM